MSTKPISVTVITTDNCQKCNLTKRRFDKVGINYDTINASHDGTIYAHLNGKTAFDYVTEDLGIRQMPVVVVDDGDQRDYWSDMRMDKIEQLVALVTSRGELVTSEPEAAEQPQITEELVRTFIEEALGGLHIDPYRFGRDTEHSIRYDKDSAVVPLLLYTDSGQISAKIELSLNLKITGPAE